MIPYQYGKWTKVVEYNRGFTIFSSSGGITTWKKGYRFKGAFGKDIFQWILYKDGKQIANISKQNVKYAIEDIRDYIFDIKDIIFDLPISLYSVITGLFERKGLSGRYRITKKGKACKDGGWKKTKVHTK